MRVLEVLGIKTDLVRPGEDLVEALLRGMERSGLRLADGDVLVVAESASSGAAICAERAAVAKAVSEREMEFEALAVVADAEEPVVPCGICRQNLIEFGEDIKVIMANMRGDAEIATAGELLPQGFIGKCLK